jgi:hypothetical protein
MIYLPPPEVEGGLRGRTINNNLGYATLPALPQGRNGSTYINKINRKTETYRGT